MFQLNRDIEFTHSLLSYLLAGYQGKFTELNILAQLSPSQMSPEIAGRTQQTIGSVNSFLNSLWQGEAICSLEWKAPETEEAKTLFTLAKQLDEDLSSQAEILETTLMRREFNELPETSYHQLLASLGRYTYSRDNYLRCFATLAEKARKEGEVRRIRKAILISDKEIKFTNELIRMYRQNPELPLEFFHALFGQVATLPGFFRTQAHDIRLLYSIYDGAFSFELAKIPFEHAEQWQQLGIPAIEAGYWEAYSITPEEAVLWIQGGVQNHAAAGLWKSWKFPPQEAVGWIHEQFSPDEATPWANEGYQPQETRVLLNRGVSHPSL
ncbi:MAG: hypothetical protein KDD60_01695, partial [Bdellovibrionales bacterium]|nr:hypothetical protein [Bdellovibrionales bacterium]